MSAALSSLIPGLPAAPVTNDLESAVDHLDAAARLEASGRGDLAAIRDGFRDVFDQAKAEFSPTADVSPPAVGKLSLAAGLWRAVVLCCGVLICLAALGPSVTPVQAFVAGAVGWLTVQTASVILWWGQGTNNQAEAAKAVLQGMAWLLSGAVALAFVWGDAAIAVWAIWGWVAAVGVCLKPGRRLGIACLGGAALAWLGTLLPGTAWDTLVADALVVTAGVLAFLMVRVRAKGPRQPSDGLGSALTWALVCVVAQLTGIAFVYVALGEQFIVVAVGAIVASAASEPMLDLVSHWSRLAAARCSSWLQTRSATIAVGVVGVLLTGSVSLVTVWACATWWGRPLSGRMLLAALLVSAVSCGIGYALRLGSGPGAAGIAMLGTVLIAAVLFLAGPVRSISGMVVASVVLVVVMLVAALRLASPRAW